MSAVDFGVRHLDEVRALEHQSEGVEEIGIGTLERVVVEARVRLDLRIEIEVIGAQPLQPVEIFVVVDRAEQPAKLAELVVVVAGERTVLDQRGEDVDLADRNELIAVGGRRHSRTLALRHGHAPSFSSLTSPRKAATTLSATIRCLVLSAD